MPKKKGQDSQKSHKGVIFHLLGEKSPLKKSSLKICTVVCILFELKFSGVTILQWIEFPISYWFLHGPYNSAALMCCLWYHTTTIIVYACAVSALLLLPVINQSLKINSATSIAIWCGKFSHSMLISCILAIFYLSISYGWDVISGNLWSRSFSKGGGSLLSKISDGREHRLSTAVSVRKAEWGMVSKYLQRLALCDHNSPTLLMDRRHARGISTTLVSVCRAENVQFSIKIWPSSLKPICLLESGICYQAMCIRYPGK